MRGSLPPASHIWWRCGATPDASGVLARPDDRAVDHLDVGIFSMRDGSQDPVPDARTSPSHEAVVAGRVRAVSLWPVAPRRSRPQHPKDAIQNRMSSKRGTPRGLQGRIGSMRRHSASVRALRIRAAPFWSLNHADRPSLKVCFPVRSGPCAQKTERLPRAHIDGSAGASRCLLSQVHPPS